MWDIGNWGSRGWQGSPVAHRTGRQRWVRVLIVLSAFRQSTSVLCSTGHRLSKLLSTLCSGDVCQCAEGEAGPGAGPGRWQGWGLPCLIRALAFREVPSPAPSPGAGADGGGWLQDEVRLLLPPRGVRSAFPGPCAWPALGVSLLVPILSQAPMQPLCPDPSLQASQPRGSSPSLPSPRFLPRLPG